MNRKRGSDSNQPSRKRAHPSSSDSNSDSEEDPFAPSSESSYETGPTIGYETSPGSSQYLDSSEHSYRSQTPSWIGNLSPSNSERSRSISTLRSITPVSPESFVDFDDVLRSPKVPSESGGTPRSRISGASPYLDSSERSYRSGTPSWISSSGSKSPSDSKRSRSTSTLRSITSRSPSSESSVDYDNIHHPVLLRPHRIPYKTQPHRKRVYVSSSDSTSSSGSGTLGGHNDRNWWPDSLGTDSSSTVIDSAQSAQVPPGGSSATIVYSSWDRPGNHMPIPPIPSPVPSPVPPGGSSATIVYSSWNRPGNMPIPPPQVPQAVPPAGPSVAQIQQIRGIDNLDLDFLRNQQQIGNSSYEIVRALSAGSFGSVYEGRRLPENDVCAIKVVKVGTLNASNESTQSEVRIVTQLINNPNNFILRFYGVLQNQHLGRVYIGTELSATGDLYRYIQRRNPQNQLIWVTMQERPAMYLIRCIARGLQHLHNLGIAHGDLKPENILLFPSTAGQQSTTGADMQQFVPKLCDFSNSRQHSNTDPPQQVLQNLRLCTINYSAPESDLQRAQPYDMLMADIYSLGCVLLALLLGGRPFVPVVHRFPDPDQTRREYTRLCTILKANRDYVTQMVRGYTCSAELKDLLLKTLTVRPEIRITLHHFLMHQWFANRGKS